MYVHSVCVCSMYVYIVYGYVCVLCDMWVVSVHSVCTCSVCI